MAKTKTKLLTQYNVQIQGSFFLSMMIVPGAGVVLSVIEVQFLTLQPKFLSCSNLFSSDKYSTRAMYLGYCTNFSARIEIATSVFNVNI